MDHLIRKHIEDLKDLHLSEDFNVETLITKFYRDKDALDVPDGHKRLVFISESEFFLGDERPIFMLA